jgi:hypothetical protein
LRRERLGRRFRVANLTFRSPLYWVAFLAGLAWAVVLWTRAAPLASALDDEIGHFLIARDVWVHPALILNAWGRVGTTMAFAAPAAAGLEWARAAALAMSAATVLVATQVARVLGVRTLALVPVLLWFQPWFHRYANAVLTEIPFSLVMITACWAALTSRLAWASALFGALPLIRHEGIAVLGLWIVVLLVQRRPRLVGLAVLPLLAYQTAFALTYDTAPFAVYLHTKPTTTYGHGSWLHYIVPLGRSIGPVVALLAAAGLVAARHNRRLLLFVAPFALYALVEAVIFRFGLFGSGGDVGYLLPLATAAAVVAAAGIDRMLAAYRVPAVRVAVSLLVIATAAWGLRTSPAQADRAAAPMRQAVHFLQNRGADMSAVTATHVWYFELGNASLPVGDGLHSPWSHPTRPGRIAPGGLVAWDCFYSNRFGLRWRRLRAARFLELTRFGRGVVVVLARERGGARLAASSGCRR